MRRSLELEIRQKPSQMVAAELGLAGGHVDSRETSADVGSTSLHAVMLSGELEDWLGIEVPSTVAYGFPSIEALARCDDRPCSFRLPDQDSTPGSEPIAIVGIGCQFPRASGPQAYWRLLARGVDAISEVPDERWDGELVYDPDPAVPGTTVSKWGGFVERVDGFDCRFFGISPREASRIDPQQRLVMDVVWEALRDAGQPAEKLAGSPVGEFIGCSTFDYSRNALAEPASIDAYTATGCALSIVANRVSYFLDLKGPSPTVDTACSSFLVAIHLAGVGLWRSEATMALAGGVNLLLSPEIAISFTKAGVMAPDGRCKAFDARANGYVRGEACGIVVLKPLARAIADCDAIYAVIRDSAVNQDGRNQRPDGTRPAISRGRLASSVWRLRGCSFGVQYVKPMVPEPCWAMRLESMRWHRSSARTEKATHPRRNSRPQDSSHSAFEGSSL